MVKASNVSKAACIASLNTLSNTLRRPGVSVELNVGSISLTASPTMM